MILKVKIFPLSFPLLFIFLWPKEEFSLLVESDSGDARNDDDDDEPPPFPYRSQRRNWPPFRYEDVYEAIVEVMCRPKVEVAEMGVKQRSEQKPWTKSRSLFHLSDTKSVVNFSCKFICVGPNIFMFELEF